MCLLPLLVRVSRGAHWLEVEHVSAAVAALVLSPLALLAAQLLGFGVDPCHALWAHSQDAAQLGALSFIALCLQTRGFQLAEASIAPLMWYVQVPFSYCLQRVLFGHAVSLASLGGAVFLIAASIANLLGTRSLAKAEPLLRAESDPGS